MIKGFMGKTHALLSVMLMCICMLIPIDFFKDTIWQLKDNILFFIVGMVVLVGGALLPDLDNVQSSAGSTLGPLGSICTLFMQSISSIIWTVLHTRRDMKPINQHRFLWHTGIIGIGLIITFWIGLPNGNKTIIKSISSYKSIAEFIENNSILFFFIIIAFMAVLCGSDMILYRLIKVFKLPNIISYIIPIIVIVYICTLSLTKIHILGICIGFGYLFHIIEDFFADSGVPILFPIPIKGQIWHRCNFLITCQTGGLINTILDLIILVVDIGLIILIFFIERGNL